MKPLRHVFAVATVAVLAAMPVAAPAMAVEIDREGHDPGCGVEVTQRQSLIEVVWSIGSSRRARLVLDLDTTRALVRSLAVSVREKPFREVASALDPVLLVRTGERDLRKRGGWTIFFDRMQTKPSTIATAALDRSRASVRSEHRRATVSLGDAVAGPFRGELRLTFYDGEEIVLLEAALETKDDAVAYLYDMGFTCRSGAPETMTWREARGDLVTRAVPAIDGARSLAVRGRAVAARFGHGALAVFPAPHRYFYPLDFSDNLANIWVGPGYGDGERPFGFGIRHDPQGDRRYVPWFNGPPGTRQELGLFLLVSEAGPEAALERVGRLTRHDRFKALPGHVVFTSHYHVEHTREILRAQEDSAASTGMRPTGVTYRIPRRLERPGFVRVFRDMGVDIVHLAEFHFGRTPRMTMEERVERLEILHAECARLSDAEFLLLPGEEPNVHLGGHWISFFPRPVYWVLNRAGDVPFASEHEKLGTVYSVGSPGDVLRLLEAEGGLAWTAHPRIKGSTGFPDRYRQAPFYRSDRFLGAAWKAMPADLSEPRLGSRVLDLLDDMSNWGPRKYALGEVDVFKIEPDHELWAHMNVNYLRLDSVPRFEDGWAPVVDALRAGAFFVTTGEVLIRDFRVDGKRSGEAIARLPNGKTRVELDLEWTFPLSHARVVSGDGAVVTPRTIDLGHTASYGKERLELDLDLSDKGWVRVEVWDIAMNGAFTQPVWLPGD